MIWHDPEDRGWEDNKAYRWNLQYSTDAACMRYIHVNCLATLISSLITKELIVCRETNGGLGIA